MTLAQPAGCTYALTPQVVEQPPTAVSAVAIGAIESDDPQWQRTARRLRRALAGRLEDSEAFDSVLTRVPAPMPSGAVLVTGRLLEVEDGSESLRFIVGYGIGSPRLRGHFEIVDPAGHVLVAFDETVRSFAGAGYAAHWDSISTDDIAEDLAEKTAAAVVRWSRGEDLVPSVWSGLW